MDTDIPRLNELIEEYERQHASAVAKANDFRRKAVEQDAKASELEIVLRHLRGRNAQPDRTVGNKTTRSVLDAVRESVTNLRQFTPDELVFAVKSKYPDMKEGTIKAQLSHLKSKGEVANPNRNCWRSTVAPLEGYVEFNEELGDGKG